MDLFLMQHGEAYSEEQDVERRLTPEGERQIRCSGKALKRMGIDMDLILTSTKKRARQSAELIAAELGYAADAIVVTETLNPTAPSDAFFEFLKQREGRDKVLVTGHLPSLGHIASCLLCEGRPVSLRFEMGGVCYIHRAGSTGAPGELRWHLAPYQLVLLAGRV